MRIYYNQLSNTLTQGVKPVWLIFGDEPWQKNDALNTIKKHSLSQGFSEIIRFTLDEKFDWSSLELEYQSMSLFAEQRIIECEIPKGKINDAGTKSLAKLCEQFPPDLQFIFHGPKLDQASQRRKWFKTLDAQGVYLPLYDLEGKQLYQWLNNQARQLQLKITPELSELLISLFEGNVLALHQELQKLSLLYGSNPIPVEDIDAIVIKQAKFNAFQLIDSLLLGEINKCITMLDQMQQEGITIGQLIWVVHKEIHQLSAMLTMLSDNTNMADVFAKYRIWDKRKPLYQKALTSINPHNLHIAQGRLAQVDLLSKSTSDFNPFVLLCDTLIAVYHGDKLAPLSLSYEFS